MIPSHKTLASACADDVIERWDSQIAKTEAEANRFAGELILPELLVRPQLFLHRPSFRSIGKVARDFGASLTATTYRFVDLTDEAVAMIWSESGHARWSHKSAAFPFWIPVSELPHGNSYAGRLFKGLTVPDDLAPVNGIYWFDRADAGYVSVLLEHSIFLPAYSAVITLLWLQSFDASKTKAKEEDVLLDELDPEAFTLQRKRWPR